VVPNRVVSEEIWIIEEVSINGAWEPGSHFHHTVWADILIVFLQSPHVASKSKSPWKLQFIQSRINLQSCRSLSGSCCAALNCAYRAVVTIYIYVANRTSLQLTSISIFVSSVPTKIRPLHGFSKPNPMASDNNDVKDRKSCLCHVRNRMAMSNLVGLSRSHKPSGWGFLCSSF
jgi:hypothetical protein